MWGHRPARGRAASVRRPIAGRASGDIRTAMLPPTQRAMAVDPLLIPAEGHRALLLGNEAIVRGALEAGVGYATGYPGTPSSEVTDSFARIAAPRGLAFEYAVNEKIALELAYAACLAGARSICAMKHLGLNVAADPLSTIPYMGVGAGLVIVSAGDPGCLTSPNEQDHRHLARMLHLPTLDPSTVQEALDFTRLAFDISEQSRLPVLLRVTTRVAHARAPARFGALGPLPFPSGFQRDPARLLPIPTNARRLRAEIPARMEIAAAYAERLLRVEGAGERVVLAAGGPAATCADLLESLGCADVTLATLGCVHPLPEAGLLTLLRGARSVTIVEELSAFLEDAVRALAHRHGLSVSIHGKSTGHFPEAFEYDRAIVRRGLVAALGLDAPAEAAPPGADLLPARPPALCAGCPHRSTFFAARAAFPADQLWFNDIGCYTLGIAPPLLTGDALLCMGAGFTLAAGVARVTGKRCVGFVGDSTFFHSGLPALVQAVKEDADVVLVVLDNQVTAMTGFQDSPAVAAGPWGVARHIDIAGVVRALGVRQVEKVDPMDLATTLAAFRRAHLASGPSVVIAEHACPVWEARLAPPAPPRVYAVDAAACRRCGRGECQMQCGQTATPALSRVMARSRSWSTPGTTPPSPVAPCAAHCPIGLCIQGYAAQIAAGQLAEAWALIAERDPLPHSVCRVCHRPCEAACIRAAVDAPVAVNELKRHVMDWSTQHPEAVKQPAAAAANGLRATVVGAGPAGLAAAWDLAMRGYAVELLDQAPEPGGLLRYGIPAYRLPREALALDLAAIAAIGVQFRGGVVLGGDISLYALLGEADAVVLAIGAGRARTLDAPGSNLPHVLPALAYLAAPDPHHGPVVVVGGGNAAIDAARTALRMGAQAVHVLFPEPRSGMPAFAEEVAAAEAEGVRLHPESRIEGIEPSGVHVGASFVSASRVIVAIGQEPSVDVGPVDPRTGATATARLFAAGDVVPGPRYVTEAMASGLRAAWGVDQRLRGAVADSRPPPPLAGDWPPAAPGTPVRADRGERPDSRLHAPAAARAEAARCMGCGSCATCSACVDAFGCPAFLVTKGQISIDAALCNGCGVCADFCPNGAIHPVAPA